MAWDDPAEADPFAERDPERIPAKRYSDEGFYRLECEKRAPPSAAIGGAFDGPSVDLGLSIRGEIV